MLRSPSAAARAVGGAARCSSSSESLLVFRFRFGRKFLPVHAYGDTKGARLRLRRHVHVQKMASREASTAGKSWQDGDIGEMELSWAVAQLQEATAEHSCLCVVPTVALETRLPVNGKGIPVNGKNRPR